MDTDNISNIVSTILRSPEFQTSLENTVRNLNVNNANNVVSVTESETSRSIGFLRQSGMTWKKISKIMGISRRTLFRFRKLYNLEEPFITNENLNANIVEILHDTPYVGEVYVMGALRARSIRAARWRVREQLNIVDPVGRADRRRNALRRREYNVQGPNYLWHIDTNHKLISFRFVFHECIDGASRCIIYLHCDTDNKAETALKCFVNGVARFGLPRRVRSDRGMENIMIAQYMLENRGLNRGSFITGKSVHNQCIERLWSEVNRVVSKPYKEIFLFMENENVLDETNEIDLFALSVVFLPRIRKSLCRFIEQWNYHGLSTEKGASPIELWQEGMLNSSCDEGDPLSQNMGNTGPVQPRPLASSNSIIVPESEINLTDEQQETITQLVPDPLLDDGYYGISHYLLIRDFLHNQIS